MGGVGTLFAIVHKTSNATSLIDWKLWRKAPSGRAEDRTEVTQHQALRVWQKPNDFFTQQLFTETFQQHLDLTGEAWWVIERDPRAPVPLGIWPVRPDRMVPVPDPQEYLSGYVYKSPDGEKVPLGVDEVIQLRMPNPIDPYRGMGPVQSILSDLDSTRFGAEWNANFFRNSAEPGGVIEVDEELDDDEFRRLSMRWNEQHRGVNAAHRVAILEGGMKWVDRKFTMRDMQFVELRDVSREVIREAFGFPKPMLGTVEDVNRANAEAGELVFARWLLLPRLERIKQALNSMFLPMFGSTGMGVEFDYQAENAMPEDREADDRERESKANAYKTLVDAGVDPADAASVVGLPAMRQRPQGALTGADA